MNFANEEERLATIVNINCVIGNLFLCIAKLIAGFMGNSAAMISDAIHSASDVFGTLIVMAGVKIFHSICQISPDHGLQTKARHAMQH